MRGTSILSCAVPFVALLVLAMAPSPGLAGTITVDTRVDAVDSSGDCSLREAVMAANTNTAVDGCPAGDSVDPDVIVLSAGTYDLDIVGLDETWGPGTEPGPYTALETPDPSMGDLDVLESVTIQGAGSALTTVRWAAEEGDRAFQVVPPAGTTAAAVFTGLTIANGSVGNVVINPEDPEVDQWSFRRMGGAIAMGPAAGLKLFGASGPGDEGGPPEGGEEGAFGDATMTLDDVRFLSNSSSADGGAVFAGGDVTATDVWFETNFAGGNGGGFYGEGEILFAGVAVVDNTAEGGGGLFLTGPTVATWTGGLLVDNYAIGGGGASIRSLANLSLTNVTISYNEAFDVGGGVYGNGSVELYNCSVVGNVAGGDADFGGGGLNSFGGGSFDLTHTLLVDNMAGAVEANCGCTGGSCDTSATFDSWGYNLEDADSCALGMEGDMFDTDALQGELEDNGGAFPTHALSLDSPAYDAGGGMFCADVDARGVDRPQGASCDIGSFELSALELDDDADGFCEGLDLGGTLYCLDAPGVGDCDDADANRFPGNPEVCDAVDNDCANGIDDGLLFETWYLDSDADGFGDVDLTVSTCDGAPAGYVADATDCDDGAELVFPGQLETCNTIDDDCDLLVDDDDPEVDLSTGETWYADADGDGYGDEASTLEACAVPEGYVDDATDCDDASSAVNPNMHEVFDNEIDDDCDGLADKEDPEFEGCKGCSTTSPAMGGLPILLGLAVLFRRRDPR